MKQFLPLGALLLVAGVASIASAQTTPSEPPGLLPADPNLWINSPPLTDEMLKGKGVFLWFFDEQCPRCRQKWPELIQTAAQYADVPVIFMGVNSGNAPQQVATYARSVGLPWPVIADVTRQLEARAGVGEISLMNIWQAAIITPQGELQRVSFNDIAGAVQRASQGASWKVEPAKIPPELKAAWRAVEMGEYAAAARDIMKHRGSNGATKEAAEALYAVVDNDLQKEGSHAWELGQEKKYYEAYLAMSQVRERFNGYEIPDSFLKAHTWLSQHEAVRNEKQAASTLESARAALNSTRSAARKRALISLRNVVDRFPDTRAAAEAQALLGSAAPGG